MATCSGRGKRRQAAKSQKSLSPTEVEELKQRWNALSVQERFRILRIDDPQLVKRAYEVQQQLYNSELSCYHNSILPKFDAAGQPIVCTGLLHFRFEWPTNLVAGTAVSPTAVVASAELLAVEDFFGYVLMRLGSFLPGGLPALRNRSLETTFEPTANTWTVFEAQLLRLSEVAVYKALSTCTANKVEEAEMTEHLSELEEIDSPKASSSAQKRIARKKVKAKKGNLQVRLEASKEIGSESHGEVLVEEVKPLSTPAEASIDSELEAAEGLTLNPAEWTQVRQRSRRHQVVTVDKDCLHCDLPPYGEVASSSCSTYSGHSRNPSTATEMSKVSDGPEICEQLVGITFLSNWEPQGSSEWHFADSGKVSLRACIKNTFWDLEEVYNESAEALPMSPRRRAQSAG